MDPSLFFFFYYAAPFLLTALVVLFFFSSSNTKYPPSGPLALPLIGHLHLLRQPVHRTLAAIAARHGPLLLLRFGSRPVLLASSPAAAKELLSTHDATFASRPFLLAGKYFAYEYSVLGVTPNGPRWRSLRRIASLELLSSTRLAAVSSLRSQEVRLLLRGLLRLHSGEEEEFQLVDVRSRVSETTFNMVTRVVDGRRYYGGEEAGAVAAGKEKIRFRRIVEEVFRMSGVTYPGDFVPAWRWLGLGKGMKRRMERLGKEMDELFQEMWMRGEEEPAMGKRRRRRREP